MKKVVQLISTMNTGGAETMVRDYALLMEQEKIDMKIIALSKHYDSVNEKVLQEHGIPIIFLSELKYGNREDLNFVQKIIRRISRYYYLRKIILREKPDVLHVHLHIGHYLKVLPLKKLNMKLLYTVHNVPERFFRKNPGISQKYFEYREVKRLVNQHGMRLIALHDTMNRQLRELFSTDQVITVNNGIEMERFCPDLYDREEKRKELGIKKDEFLVGHVGRYHVQKNHEMIVAVFCELLKTKPNARLLLVGGSGKKEEIVRMISQAGITDKVIMLENRADVPALMKAMDVFLFPSKWEGFGNVLIEAQSIGVRCVVSDKVPESVRLTELVTVCDLREPLQVWVDAILNKKNHVTPTGSLNDYDMKNCAKKLQKIYLEEE